MKLANSQRLILASSSPRRYELLSTFGLPFEVIKPNTLEQIREGEQPEDYVIRNAREKAAFVADELKRNREGDSHLIIAADTIVILNGQVLEKPQDKQDAARMLRALSDTVHEVLTGFVVRGDRAEKSCLVKTRVYFKSLSEQEIAHYISSGEPLDKAGAYAIQGIGSYMVSRIEGSYSNVVGLPLTELWELVKDLSS